MSLKETTLLPSGAQHEIAFEGRRAVACEVGATLRSYTVDGVEVLDGFSSRERSTAGRGEVLAPWPNRLDGGRYAFEGVQGRAALDEPERGNAIHGLVRWLPWAVSDERADSITLSCMVHPQPAYPWQIEVSVEYRLDEGGLVATARATNLSDVTAPYGMGFHPYLTVGTPSVDEAILRVPADRRLLTDDRGLPVGEEPVDGSTFDFRAARAIGATELDTAFTRLSRETDGTARVDLATPDGSRAIALWVDGSFDYLMVYTGDTLEPAARRRRGVAIEPMSCPPNAFRSGDGLIRLEPGGSWAGRWGIAS